MKVLKQNNINVPIYIICSDDDKTLHLYQEIYGDSIITFSKDEMKKITDTYDNFGKEKDGVVVYARNKCFYIAEQLGFDYFLMLDDDYTDFQYKIPRGDKLTGKVVNKNLGAIIDGFFKYLTSSEQITAIAFAQGGDFIGGVNNGIETSTLRRRKLMNAFFFKTSSFLKFSGRLNEDVNLYVTEGSRGKVFLTIPYISLNQMVTQTNSGGLTESYKDNGTYVKSFYSVITRPSSVKVKQINGNTHKRLHHQIKWALTVPMIIPEIYKK